MELRSKSASTAPALYGTTEFISIDQRTKHLKERREVLKLKSDNRRYALEQLDEVKKKVIERSWGMFQEKNGDARKVRIGGGGERGGKGRRVIE